MSFFCVSRSPWTISSAQRRQYSQALFLPCASTRAFSSRMSSAPSAFVDSWRPSDFALVHRREDFVEARRHAEHHGGHVGVVAAKRACHPRPARLRRSQAEPTRGHNPVGGSTCGRGPRPVIWGAGGSVSCLTLALLVDHVSFVALRASDVPTFPQTRSR
jgi:hypothetical protein